MCRTCQFPCCKCPRASFKPPQGHCQRCLGKGCASLALASPRMPSCENKPALKGPRAGSGLASRCSEAPPRESDPIQAQPYTGQYARPSAACLLSSAEWRGRSVCRTVFSGFLEAEAHVFARGSQSSARAWLEHLPRALLNHRSTPRPGDC